MAEQQEQVNAKTLPRLLCLIAKRITSGRAWLSSVGEKKQKTMAPEEESTVHDELTSVTWRSHSAVISRERTWAAEGLTDIASSSFEAATERQMESDCQIIMQTTSHISFLCSSGLRNLLKLQDSFYMRGDFISRMFQQLYHRYVLSLHNQISFLRLNYVPVDSDAATQSQLNILLQSDKDIYSYGFN